MSFDTRVRRRRLDLDAPPRLKGLHGGYGAGVNLPIGSGIGQIPEPQPASANVILDSSAPTVGAGLWTLNGTAAVADATADQWNAGFIPQLITSNNGNADSLQATVSSANAATVYSVSIEVTTDSDSACVAPSSSAAVEVNWTGGVARTDRITFNPGTGAITSSSAGIASTSVTGFIAIDTNGAQLNTFRITFTTLATPAATNAANFRVYPRTTAGVGDIVAGAFQLEAYASATAYIPTDGSVFIGRRNLGLQPRQVTDRSQPFSQWLPSSVYQYGIDSGFCFEGQNAGGQNVFTVPNPPAATVLREFNGDTVTLVTNFFGVANPLGTFLVQGGAAIKFFAPSFSAAGVNSFVIPPSATYQDVAITLQYDGANGWHIISSNVGAFNAAGVLQGGINPGVGGAGVVLRSNGAAYVASQSTYPDLVAADQVLFATAANTVGSVSGFKYNDTSGTLTVKGHTFVCTAAGECTQPLQPAFMAYKSSTTANATGDGTAVSPTVFDTEVFDQNADYNNGTGVFTAPVTGRYQLNTMVAYDNTAAANYTITQFVTSNRAYAALGAGTTTTQSSGVCAALADMDAADTAQISSTANGGTKTVGLLGNATNANTQFSGFLAC